MQSRHGPVRGLQRASALAGHELFVLLLGLSSLGVQPAQASEMALRCETSSPPHRVAMIELYTSEGCSSCPPADNWLSALSRSSGLGADKVLPLAFHVDYWDYIGWKDPFATPQFTNRQKMTAARTRQRSLYTPQVVVDGADWRQWWEPRPFLDRVARVNQQVAPVTIRVSALSRPGDRGQVQFSADVMPAPSGMPDGRYALHVGLFEHALSNDVARGENAGRTLRHDAVVRAWQRVGSLRDGRASFQQQTLRVPGSVNLVNAGIAAVIQDADGASVQATSCLLKAAS